MHNWHLIKSAAAQPAERFNAALRDPRSSQCALLMDIVKRNGETAFGQRHDFANIGSIEDFQAKVPVMTHQDYSAEIDEIAANRANVLTADPVIAFERTGGTASGGKLIPYTTRGLEAFRDAILPWLHDLVVRHGGVTQGPAYVAISPATRQPAKTASGLPVGLESDAAYLGEEVAPAFASLLAVSPETGFIESMDDWRLATLSQLVACRQLAFVSVWSPTFFLALLDALSELSPQIGPLLSQSDSALLDAALVGGRLDPKMLWPQLSVISCWADAASAPYAERLRHMFPDTLLQPKGLLATEAAITLPFGEGKGCVPALTSSFLEFRDATGTFWLAGELEVDETYDVILTTQSGLYRYDIGDRVRCIGRHGPVERLVFVGRAGIVSDMVGEKLTEEFVNRIIGEIGLPSQLVARDGINPQSGLPHYELRIDGEVFPGFTDDVERELRSNPQYDYARKINQLGPLRLVADRGFIAREMAAGSREGKRLGDIKPMSLVPIKA